MKVIFFIVMTIHAVIHLVGFIKSFNYIELSELTNPIPRFQGIMWLVTSILLFVSLYGLWYDYHWWWMVALPAVIISQTLIFLDWTEAGFGSIANLIVAVGIVLGYGHWKFSGEVEREVSILSEQRPDVQWVADSQLINELPVPIAKWLERSGVVDKPLPRLVLSHQTGKMRTDMEGKWMEFWANQWINPHEPAFVWKAWVYAWPGIHLAGMDRYNQGEGRMWIQLMSLFSVVDETGPEIDDASAVRFLAEIAWVPGIATLPFIEWEEIDSTSARATMTYGNSEVYGIFEFDENGDLSEFRTQRYYKRGDEYVMKDWVARVRPGHFLEFGDYRIPSRYKVSWDLEAGRFTWLDFELMELNYTY